MTSTQDWSAYNSESLSRSKNGWVRFFTLSFLMILLTGCVQSQICFSPNLDLCPPSASFDRYPDCFPPLSEEEFESAWGRELAIGLSLAKEQEFYRAITAFKRSLVLIPEASLDRRLQVQYEVIMTYYVGQRFTEAIDYFESSDLVTAKPDFPGYRNLLILLHDAYLRDDQPKKAQKLEGLSASYEKGLAERMELSAAIRQGDLSLLNPYMVEQADIRPVKSMLNSFYARKKNVRTAQTLNALLPGLGYAYVGQKQTAVTSFLVNALFTWGAYHFIREGHTAAGLFTASLEAGWYLGGINGAGLEANEYNERLYEDLSRNALSEERLYPVMMFQCVF